MESSTRDLRVVIRPRYRPRDDTLFSPRSVNGGDGILSGSAGRHPPQPGELRNGQAGTRCCCSGSPARSCCDWPTGSSWRCCSSSRREGPVRASGQDPKSMNYIAPEGIGIRPFDKCHQGLHVPLKRCLGPDSILKIPLIFPKLPDKAPFAGRTQLQGLRIDPIA